jgi:hypothetical protein
MNEARQFLCDRNLHTSESNNNELGLHFVLRDRLTLLFALIGATLNDAGA